MGICVVKREKGEVSNASGNTVTTKRQRRKHCTERTGEGIWQRINMEGEE
jgi:hypothetical protein